MGGLGRYCHAADIAWDPNPQPSCYEEWASARGPWERWQAASVADAFRELFRVIFRGGVYKDYTGWDEGLGFGV